MEQEKVQEFADFLDKVKKLSYKSIAHYIYYFNHIEGDTLNQLTVNKLIKKHGNNSGIRAMFMNYKEFLEMEGVEVPKIIIPKPTGSKPKRIIKEISNEDLDLFSKQLHEINIIWGIIFDLIREGALRRNEISSIMFNSFDWKKWLEDPESMIRMKIIGKRNKERTVLINPETATRILEIISNNYNLTTEDAQKKTLNSPIFLFQDADGDKVYEIFRYGKRRLWGKMVRPHELRHHRATELYKRGVNIRDVKNFLGHSSLATTEIYLHTSESESIDKIEKNLMK